METMVVYVMQYRMDRMDHVSKVEEEDAKIYIQNTF